MEFTRYVIDYILEKEDGTYERVQTTRATLKGMEDVLKSLRDDPTCVTLGVSENI
jgi:hypothetical protein